VGDGFVLMWDIRACFLERLAEVPGFEFLQGPLKAFSKGKNSEEGLSQGQEGDESGSVGKGTDSSPGDGEKIASGDIWEDSRSPYDEIEDEWRDLVEELGPVEENPTPLAPQWEYPPGVDPSDFDGSRPEVASSWSSWETARTRFVAGTMILSLVNCRLTPACSLGWRANRGKRGTSPQKRRDGAPPPRS